MRSIFIFFFFFLTHTLFGQCHQLLSDRLYSISDIPYLLVENFVFDVKTGETVAVKIKNVAYKTKLGFIFETHDVGDTLKVSLITLNRKVLASKIITKNDYFFRYEPFRKSDNYFLIIKSKPILDEYNKPKNGCIGIAVVERVKKKAFKKLQKIEWGSQKN